MNCLLFNSIRSYFDVSGKYQYKKKATKTSEKTRISIQDASDWASTGLVQLKIQLLWQNSP